MRKWQIAGTSAAAITPSTRPPQSCTRPRKNAASESGLLTARSSSDPPRIASTEVIGTCATKRRRAAACSSVQTRKKASRSADARAMNSGRSACSSATRSRVQSVAQPKT